MFFSHYTNYTITLGKELIKENQIKIILINFEIYVYTMLVCDTLYKYSEFETK